MACGAWHVLLHGQPSSLLRADLHIFDQMDSYRDGRECTDDVGRWSGGVLVILGRVVVLRAVTYRHPSALIHGTCDRFLAAELLTAGLPTPDSQSIASAAVAAWRSWPASHPDGVPKTRRSSRRPQSARVGGLMHKGPEPFLVSVGHSPQAQYVST